MREGFVKRRDIGVALALLLGVAALASAQTRVGGYVNLGIGIRQPSPSSVTRTAVNSDGTNREEARTMTELDSSGVVDFGGGIVLANRFTLRVDGDRGTPPAVLMQGNRPEPNYLASAGALPAEAEQTNRLTVEIFRGWTHLELSGHHRPAVVDRSPDQKSPLGFLRLG